MTMNIDDKHFSSTAMIQLSLNTSENHLTVKIIRVKGLRASLTNILVKMTLIPDRKPLECQTRAVDNRSGSCVFNEQFTFEINEEDTSKRLCFSVYEYERSQMHLQGCLSFGIRNTIAKQRIAGWFHLLPEDIGEFRHKQVRHVDGKQVTKINRDIADLEEHQFIVVRNTNDSFGFTVVGDSPSFVGKVTENSPAAVAGLKSGDYIVKINDRNVSRAQQRTVSQLIKHSKHSVIVDIHRYPNVPMTHEFSSIGTISTEDCSTGSDSSMSPYARPMLSQGHFVDLGQLGHYTEPKAILRQTSRSQCIFPLLNSSILAVQGSPTSGYL